jgi:adenosine deaminase CECR1
MRSSLFLIVFSSFLLLIACQSAKQVTDHQGIKNKTTYLNQRQALLKADSALYFNKEVQLNEKEQILNKHLLAMQQKMIAHYKATHFFPPARNFYASKKHVEQTPLFNILKKMPKGGILHLHSGAMGDAQWVVDKAISLPEMYVYWGESNDQYVKGQLHAYPPNKAPNGFQQVQTLAKQADSFQKELHGFLTFDAEMDRDSVDIWAEFERVFQRINGFITYEKVAADYLLHGIDLLIQDNIQHAEFRTFFGPRFYDLQGNKASLEAYASLMNKIQAVAKQKDPDFTLNMIHQSLRFFDKEKIWSDMQEVHQFRRDFPRWIRGFDLVAEEDAGHTTLYHVDEFLKLDSLEKATGVSVPLFLHDGESDWASTSNLYDAVLLGTKRIGHGFNLFRFPNLIEEVKARDICVEVNPLSNQILGYIRDLRIHPASTYLRRGVNCIISSDDPLIFDYQGLSYDFWAIFLAWELDLKALKKLCKNSISYSALPDDQKAAAMQVWEKRWEKFVDETLIMMKE